MWRSSSRLMENVFFLQLHVEERCYNHFKHIFLKINPHIKLQLQNLRTRQHSVVYNTILQHLFALYRSLFRYILSIYMELWLAFPFLFITNLNTLHVLAQLAIFRWTIWYVDLLGQLLLLQILNVLPCMCSIFTGRSPNRLKHVVYLISCNKEKRKYQPRKIVYG
jgi:hypothetical protein